MTVKLADIAGAELSFAAREHAELRQGVARIERAATLIDQRSTAPVMRALEPVCAWLVDDLMPHVAWEMAVIFPEIDNLTGSTVLTNMMRFDHLQINRASVAIERDVDELRPRSLSSDERREIAFDLITLASLIRAHIEREEEFVLPHLDRGTR